MDTETVRIILAVLFWGGLTFAGALILFVWSEVDIRFRSWSE
jgi:hypothetical protein